MNYGPRDKSWFLGPGDSVNCMAVGDGDGGVGMRFNAGFVFGDEGGGLDEIDV